MQIFQPFECPEQCAECLDDKRVVKMMTESAQILSTAARLHRCTSVPYKSYQPGRKLIKWAAASNSNYLWLTEHFRCLVRQYQFRYPKGGMKGSHDHPYVKSFLQASRFIPAGPMTPRVFDSTAIEQRTAEILGVHLSYKALLLLKWVVQDKRVPTRFGNIITTSDAVDLLQLTNEEWLIIRAHAGSIGVDFREKLGIKKA